MGDKSRQVVSKASEESVVHVRLEAAHSAARPEIMPVLSEVSSRFRCDEGDCSECSHNFEEFYIIHHSRSSPKPLEHQ